MTHICVSKLNIIGSDNGLSPGRHQAIIWTNSGILLIGTLGTKFSEILGEIHIFSFKKMHLKMSSAKWRPFCLGLNMFMHEYKRCVWKAIEKNMSADWKLWAAYHVIHYLASLLHSSLGNSFTIQQILWIMQNERVVNIDKSKTHLSPSCW